MIRLAVAAALCLTAVPAFAADDKTTSCAYQADVVAAVRQARIDRVKEQKVREKLLAASPSWPESYNAAIPLVTPWVYEMKRRDVVKQDLAAAWKELCLSQ